VIRGGGEERGLFFFFSGHEKLRVLTEEGEKIVDRCWNCMDKEEKIGRKVPFFLLDVRL